MLVDTPDGIVLHAPLINLADQRNGIHTSTQPVVIAAVASCSLFVAMMPLLLLGAVKSGLTLHSPAA